MIPDTAVKITSTAAALLLVGVVFTGCAAAPNEAPQAVQPSTSATFTHEAPAATPTPYPTSTQVDPRKPAYEAAIASWTEPLPPGYSWPAWDDLPHIASGQLLPMDNAEGVYRCILIDAAWHAYFEDNDAPASKEYATRADEFLIPDNPSSQPVTRDGVIVDENLASASGICQGISGPLQ